MSGKSFLISRCIFEEIDIINLFTLIFQPYLYNFCSIFVQYVVLGVTRWWQLIYQHARAASSRTDLSILL